MLDTSFTSLSFGKELSNLSVYASEDCAGPLSKLNSAVFCDLSQSASLPTDMLPFCAPSKDPMVSYGDLQLQGLLEMDEDDPLGINTDGDLLGFEFDGEGQMIDLNTIGNQSAANLKRSRPMSSSEVLHYSIYDTEQKRRKQSTVGHAKLRQSMVY